VAVALEMMRAATAHLNPDPVKALLFHPVNHQVILRLAPDRPAHAAPHQALQLDL
jgi:hypothetical protein